MAFALATNLDPADADGIPDVYVKELGTPASSADLAVVKRDGRDPVRLAHGLHREGGQSGTDQATGVIATDRLPTAVRSCRRSPAKAGGAHCDAPDLRPGDRPKR